MNLKPELWLQHLTEIYPKRNEIELLEREMFDGFFKNLSLIIILNLIQQLKK